MYYVSDYYVSGHAQHLPAGFGCAAARRTPSSYFAALLPPARPRARICCATDRQVRRRGHAPLAVRRLSGLVRVIRHRSRAQRGRAAALSLEKITREARLRRGCFGVRILGEDEHTGDGSVLHVVGRRQSILLCCHTGVGPLRMPLTACSTCNLYYMQGSG